MKANAAVVVGAAAILLFKVPVDVVWLALNTVGSFRGFRDASGHRKADFLLSVGDVLQGLSFAIS